MKLLACEACARHLRSNEPTCPFCGAAVKARPDEQPRRRAVRAVMYASAAAVSVACGTSSEPVYGAPVPPTDASADQSMQAAYGGPPFDAAIPDARPDSPAGAYGGPPVDSGGD